MFSQSFDVRFYETDALQHVNNTVLVGWFESAREPIFRMFTPELDLNNWPLILASYQVDFLAQIYYGQQVEVRTGIKHIGNSSFVVHHEVWQNDSLCAKGTATMVHFDYQIKKASPIPAAIKAQLEAHKVSLDE